MTVLGAIIRAKKYVRRLLTTEVSNVSLPPNESVLDFHEDNLDWNLSNIGFRFFVRFIFAPIGTPR